MIRPSYKGWEVLSHPFAYSQQIREGFEFAHSGERTEGEPRCLGLAAEQGSR